MKLLDKLRHKDDATESEAPRRTATDCRKERAQALAVYGWCLRGGIVIFVLALMFTMVNVQIFAAAGHEPGATLNSTFHWTIAWFLDPMASLALVTTVVLGGLLARYGHTSGWLTTIKWFSGLGTWAMNIWPAIDHPHPSGVWAGVLLHSIAPGLVLLGAEAIPWVRLQMTRIADQLEREAQGIEAAEVAAHKAIADREAAERRAEIDARNEETRRIREEQAAEQRRVTEERVSAKKLADEIALTQARKEAAEAQAAADAARAEADRAEADKLAQKAAVAAARRPRSGGARTGGSGRARKTDRTAPPDVTDLLPAGRTVADRLASEGKPLTRSALLAGLRSDRVSCSTDRASALLDRLNTERSEYRDGQGSAPARPPVGDRSDRPLHAVAGGGR